MDNILDFSHYRGAHIPFLCDSSFNNQNVTFDSGISVQTLIIMKISNVAISLQESHLHLPAIHINPYSSVHFASEIKIRIFKALSELEKMKEELK